MNFTIESRFRGAEYDLIAGLVAARGGRRLPQQKQSRLQRLRTFALMRGARAFPMLARRARLLRSPVSVEEFQTAAQAVTGQPLTYTVKDGIMWCRCGDTSWAYPRSDAKQVTFGFITAVGPERWMRAKYTLPGFVDLESSDVVVDCGAFVGGFSRAALSAGAEVIAVEPSRLNRMCLEENLRGYQVDIRAAGLGRESGQFRFREASTGVDSTFGKMDEGVPIDSFPVSVLTIDELARESGVIPTFVKIEAEGMEVQVLEGMQEIRPEKVAVDASPEGGSDDRGSIKKRLASLGYTVRTDMNMIYGRQLG